MLEVNLYSFKHLYEKKKGLKLKNLGFYLKKLERKKKRPNETQRKHKK